ncbi:MAG: NAD(P)-dependent oxidoreductase EC-YbbO [uncultured Thiotrichaceae bacterium]|uniref:NAD(P)-dependent oxidoreductase EC-YbbO n=1 Tax=uncultured Thiotrichaceae bacterium TaxID=298394 RepID=A0A6S6UA57_9GAMM|nr:MAG: NAD(P)-dependent oxidoreductase EC-YbbO [uncultured Thiotrichaceae bacterium]
MKTVLVTGCSTGIGKITAQGLREKGYHVIATVRKPEDTQWLKQQGISVFMMDYADAESVLKAATDILEHTGGTLDAVFHNGAYGQPGAVEDLSRDVIEKQFASNVFGWMQLTNLILPVMRKQGHGTIIFNSSLLGIVTLPFRGAYNASKYALEGFADTLRMELLDSPINVVLIEPGPIASEFRANSLVKLEENIDVENSVHRDLYLNVLKRLKTKGPAVPFTLPAEAVLAKVEQALMAKRPRPRYYVTFPTYLFGFFKRVLPTSWLDRVLTKLGGS